MNRLRSIRLNRRTLRRAAIVVAGLLAAPAVGAVLVCQFFGIHSKADVMFYRAMLRDTYHPIWKDLALQRIKKGDSLESVVQRYRPTYRDDYGSYTKLTYSTHGSLNATSIQAQDGTLVAAGASCPRCHHTFFSATPEERRALRQAEAALEQRKAEAQRVAAQQEALERDAFRIHLAATSGQDVFLARVIDQAQVGDDSPYDKKVIEDLTKIYGEEYLESMGLVTKLELTVEVTTALHGDLQSGTVLTFTVEEYEHAQAGQPEPVFLHFQDARLIDPHSQGTEIYLTVPRQALDWYQSLTEDQVKDLEARCLAEWAKRGITPQGP